MKYLFFLIALFSCNKPDWFCAECRYLGTSQTDLKECSSDEKYIDSLVVKYNSLGGGTVYFCRKRSY